MFENWLFLLASNSVFAATILTVKLSTDNNPGGLGQPDDLRYCLNTLNAGLNAGTDDYNIIFEPP